MWIPQIVLANIPRERFKDFINSSLKTSFIFVAGTAILQPSLTLSPPILLQSQPNIRHNPILWNHNGLVGECLLNST